jgi:hypothetical protein
MAATPEDEELVADGDEPVAGEVVSPPFSPWKDSWLVQVALKEVAFVQWSPIVLFEPLTNLTGAHCYISLAQIDTIQTTEHLLRTWNKMPSGELSTT